MSDGNDFLMSGGTPAAPFPSLGSTVAGYITTAPQKRAVTDPQTGEVKTFANGDPIYQVTVTLLTQLRDPNSPDDDGSRTLYIKNRMLSAIREAVKRAGAPGLEVGGYLSVTWTDEEANKNRALNPTKIYSAQYRPPAPGADANAALMTGAVTSGGSTTVSFTPTLASEHNPVAGILQPAYAATTAQAAPPATGMPWPPGQAPWQNGQSATAGNGAPPPAGVDPAVWARMDDHQRQQIVAAMGNLPPF